MSLLSLPEINAAQGLGNIQFDMRPDALERWEPGIRAAADDGAATISIYDRIGESYDGEGVTTKRISAALRNIGARDVVVNVNSPGGDFFQGVAIYNLLREHQGEVTVKILGLAASAASVIAMAGDKVQIARAGFLMIHNAWVMAIGNRNDLAEVAATLKPFDDAMAGIYASRTGEENKAMAKLMDAETWIGGEAAIDGGFADELLASDQVQTGKGKASASAARRIEAGLRASGMPKSEAMRLISEMKASAGDPAGGGEGDPTERSRRESAAAAGSAHVLNALQGFSLPL